MGRLVTVAKTKEAAANAPDSEANLTVEQLAYETGMSVRNIRNHQSGGLLPPPEVRARIGYYGPEHVARLRLIQEMQAEGFKLSAISRLIGEHGADADRFVGLRQADEAVGVQIGRALNSSHMSISYAVFCLKKKNNHTAGF